MENYFWYDRFIETLHEKYPNKTQLVQELMNILPIEREAVYRRLRKDVIFPFNEVMRIASAWNISLDRLVNVNFEEVPFMMRRLNYLAPVKKELDFMRGRIQFLNLINSYTKSEYMEVCNKLPWSIISGFTTLYRFDLFKWAYEDTNNKEISSFSQIIIPAKMQELMSEYFQSIRNVTSMNYIWELYAFRLFDS
jgi:hypothetical protein